MKRIYEKSKLAFTLLWIGAYVIMFSYADKLSATIGVRKIITAPLSVVFVLAMVLFLAKHKLTEEHGLCKFKGSYKGALFFIPLVPILGLYLWNGVAWAGSAAEAILSVAAMLCVGFVEEMIFRGFLFTTMRKDNLKAAILVSSLTFGLGHIVNLLNGRDLLPTLLQVCYATSLGLLLTMLFIQGKSLLPCMVLHGILNVISVFNVPRKGMQSIVSSAILCLISAAYALWIWKHSENQKEQLNER